MNKTISLIIAALLLGGTFYIVTRDSSPQSSQGVSTNQAGGNVEIKDGIQYITITARGGYSPRLSEAKSGISTKLVIKTNGTYDCSSSLVIKSLGYRGFLPSTGETVIDVGTPKKGDVIQGVCGMGMYSFQIRFQE